MDNIGKIDSNTITVTDDDSGQRFDKFLIRRFHTGGKGFVYKMLRKKRVKLNGGRATGNEILAPGDVVTFYISPETQAALAKSKPAATGLALDILYEDGDVLIVNKAVNVLTHPDLTDAAASRAAYGGFAPVAVNRLDRNTTGAVVLAKTLPAARELSQALRERRADKLYLTAVTGDVTGPMTLTGGYRKDGKANKASIGDENAGKTAFMEFRPLYKAGAVTILEVRLVTGLSHQIRAQLQAAGFPVIGDPKYGDAAINKYYRELYGVTSQLLHAGSIAFHGMGGRLAGLNGSVFTAPPPKPLARLIKESSVHNL